MGDTRLDFLTKEAVVGELLSERLGRGGFSAEEALRRAIEIGSALQKIHSKGQVHGGLTPLCIALTDKGARILQPVPSPVDRAPYRAPEQLRGEEADVRCDVFAYGAVLYEMASGKRAFPGTGQELNEAILNRTPPALDGSMPAVLDEVIAGCMAKDPSLRRQRVQNAVIELKLAGGRNAPRVSESRVSEPVRRPALAAPAHMSPTQGQQFTPPPPAPPAPPRPAFGGASKPPVMRPAGPAITAPRVTVLPYGAQDSKTIYGITLKKRVWIMGAAVLALAATSVAAVVFLQSKPAPPVLKFAVTQPENTSFPGMPSVSPDGRYLTFSAVGPEGRRMLWLRPLDALHATIIQGSEGASAPFWSPDSQQIAFFGGKYLKRVRITGGAPENICPVDANPGGGAWNRDGTILFAPSLYGGFSRVTATGGKPQTVLNLDESKQERADLWPQFLPDGKHFVFYQQTDNQETSGVYVGVLDSSQYQRLFVSQTNAVYSPESAETQKTGFLLFINDRSLMAQPFNAGRQELTKEAFKLADNIGAVRSMALAPLSASATGVLVYQGVGQPTRQLIWMDRTGKQIAPAGDPGTWGPPKISPDGNKAIAARTGSDGKTAHLWLLELSGGAEQLTDGPMHEGSPVWSPDASRVAYFGRQGDAYDIFIRGVRPDSKAELYVKGADRKFPADWSHDGRYITFSVEQGKDTHLDLWGLSVGDRRFAPIMQTVYSEGFGAVSPDGKWMAYQSDQSGKNEVFVQAFDGLSEGTKRRWQVSKGGGLPHWRSDSRELFYMTTEGRVMSVNVSIGPDGGIEAAPPQSLFQTRPLPKSWNLYDVSQDGQRFLVNVPLEWTSAAPITVLTNWTEKLKE
ncbi:MAG: protein kinase [Candidatus Solibacter sp.]